MHDRIEGHNEAAPAHRCHAMAAHPWRNASRDRSSPIRSTHA